MTLEEITKIEKYLQENFNKTELFYFNYVDGNKIEARYKENDMTFCIFNKYQIEKVMEIMEEEKN